MYRRCSCKKKKENVAQKTRKCRRSHCGAAETDLTRNHEVAGSIPDPSQQVKDLALP